ncbi:MAG: PKD domain-containing protein [Candidatus Kapaibacterium sp.]
MRILGTLLFMACIVLQLNANAQSSGWADSAGYKQQIMPTKSIRQVLYSPSGDRLYSVHLDTLYRISHWDAVTGKLLRKQSIDSSGYKLLYSVTIANDGLTYTVCGLQVNDSCTAKIYSLNTDVLLNSVTLKLKNSSEVQASTAIYDSTLRILRVRFEASDVYGMPPSGSRYGGVFEYSLVDGKQQLKHSENGVTNKWSTASGINVSAWVGFYHKVILSYKGEVIEDTRWMKSILWNDTIPIREDLPFDILGSHPIFSQYALNYFPLLTPDGKHFCMIDHQVLRHRTLSPYALVSTITLPFIPTFAQVAPTNNHILMSSGRSIILYDIFANSITDTLSLTFESISASFRPQSHTVVFASRDGYMRTLELPFSMPSIPNDFRADSTTAYTDSAITFTVTTRRVPLRLRWDFGDTTTDSTLSVIHRYKSPGTYSVQLFITDSSGTIDTIMKKDYISILPSLIPDFSGTPQYGISQLDVQFTDKSKGNIITWLWDFGDKQVDSVQNPKHTYSGHRYYNVTLTISDGFTVATIVKPMFINLDTIPSNSIMVRQRWISGALSYIGTPGNWRRIENTFSKGILGNDSKLYVYSRECGVESYKGPDPTPLVSYNWQQSISVFDSSTSQWKIDKSYSPPDYSPMNICQGTNSAYSGFQIIRYRNRYVTSFTGWVRSLSYITIPSIMFFSNGRVFTPSGWTHDFNGAFLPDGTDIYLFNHGTSTSIQFFIEDSVLIARDSMVGEVMKPLVSIDSQNVSIISNLYSGKGDSTRWMIVRTYSSEGLLLSEKKIVKTRTIHLTDAANFGLGDFLVTGWVTSTDSLGIKHDSGYIAKLGSDGRIAWEYCAPAWKQFKKIEKLSTGHYAAWGIPLDGFNHGFLAFRSDGTILSDNRLVGAQNGFSPSDFVVGAGTNSLWFIGSESVPNQGQRAAVYLCTNPMSAVTSVAEGEASDRAPSTFSAEVFPLPAVDRMTVRLSIPRAANVRVSMVSALGTEQEYPAEHVNAGMNEFTLSTAALPTGMYILCIRFDSERCVCPVVVLR